MHDKNLPTIIVEEDTKALIKKTGSLLKLKDKLISKNKNKLSNYKISNDPNKVIEFEDNILAWKDVETGLMWEVKNKENIEHHYVWSEKWVERAWHPEELTDDVKDAFSYAKKLNKINYAGFNDWRVPTKEELETILTEEKINDYFIKKPLSKNTEGYYWSSSFYADRHFYAWHVHFVNGDTYYDVKNISSFVRCVR